MAKRFTDTEKFIDPWFRRLASKHKLLWDWLLCNCDFAGVINVDFEFIEMVLNEKFEDSVLSNVFGDRIVKLDNLKFFIPKFIRFQYGKLNKNSRVHASVIGRLVENGIDPDTLSIPYKHPMSTPKDKEKAKEMEIEMNKEKEKEKEKEEMSTVPTLVRRITPAEIVDLWNQTLARRGFNPIPCLGGGDHNLNCLSAIEWLPTLKHWADLFEKVEASPFLSGVNDRKWIMPLTWLVNYDNALRVLINEFDEKKATENLFSGIPKSEVSA